ncbi:hypothetical protein [Leptospira stimsonii]|uniref:Uncharacterized protein n=1 Tax=Leptospira stimsonii TaxID=2202203 RepID=A0A4R9L8K1_9LEPT|nr:hypothetical protein [Leptospira stimsonii]RHX84480.1 hypothetical protein DLM78_17305 [Leptospira stimsonii]TGK15303.1 hypothetical protein EHO98_15355 [Leptospira stimsonii]TGM22863.1 hypothetical protein EHQ90_00210 [Leptospira stimsonii]
MIKKSFFICIFLSSSLFSNEFRTGVHLINRDRVSHEIVYTESMVPSSKICFVKKSTKAMKNGIAPIPLRKNEKGFRILSRESDPQKFQIITKVVIDAETVVPCLSMELDSIGFKEKAWNQRVKNQTLTIKNGELVFSKN